MNFFKKGIITTQILIAIVTLLTFILGSPLVSQEQKDVIKNEVSTFLVAQQSQSNPVVEQQEVIVETPGAETVTPTETVETVPVQTELVNPIYIDRKRYYRCFFRGGYKICLECGWSECIKM